MVAADARNIELGVCGSPMHERASGGGVVPASRVNQIAKNDKGLCSGCAHKSGQPMQVMVVRGFRNREAGSAECGRFPKVQISDQQRARGLVQDRPIGKQLQRCAAQSDGECFSH